MFFPLLMALAASEAVAGPVWISRPTGEQIARVYPIEALQDQLSGKVVFNCIWSEQGRPTDCVVESETPLGAGFAEAGLALSKVFHAQAALSDGTPIAGRPYRLPIWFLPPSTEVDEVKIAAPTGPTGKVTLNCRTDPDARLDNCFVQGRPPEGLAEVALKLVEDTNASRPHSERKERPVYARVALPLVFVRP